MYGYGNDLIKNLNMLLEGELKEVDVCTINDEPFIYVAGFGKFLNIPYETSRKSKIALGYLAYIKKGFEELFGRVKLYDISYEVNGETHSGSYSVMYEIGVSECKISNITLAELYFGAYKSGKQKHFDDVKEISCLFESYPISHLKKYGEIRWQLEQKGIKIIWDVDGEKKEIDTEDIVIKTTKTRLLLPSKNIQELFK